jgi:5-methylcytosine-specific restriction endonuclease McrA
VSAALSNKIARAVRLRDGHCRFPGCDRRTGLQIHHLWPRSWGGTDDIANLAAVCVGGGTDHHTQLVPHGELLLLGNPNRPDGLRLMRRDELADLAEIAKRANEPPRPTAS